MEISTWFPQSEHFIVGMKVDSLGAPAILLGGSGSTLMWNLGVVYSDTTGMFIGEIWRRNGIRLS
ncbi:hypothetical protein VSDG_04357 [Cytospora chrysosperma]|uniref:Uncharacterized protein n=1 Tax=Cytospora chrysosperma TaxID=252740 RepID=A0A423W5P1_CYTCH|nr:hypothetical protein VSDG_04357 [Valsa sordida]